MSSLFRRHPIVCLIGVLAIVFMWLPIIVVIVNSLNADAYLVRWGGVTLRWFQKAAGDSQVRSAMMTSLEMALATSALSIVIALTGVLWWRRASRSGRQFFNGTVYARLVLPEVVLASAMFLVLTRLQLQLGMVTAVLGHTVWDSAFATVIIQARARMLSDDIEEAGADLGASPVRVFFHVTLPALAPGILAAGVLAFSLSFDDVVTSFFLSGSRLTTLPLLVMGFIRFRVTPEVNAIGALVTSSMIASTLFVLWLVGRSARDRGSLAKRIGL